MPATVRNKDELLSQLALAKSKHERAVARIRDINLMLTPHYGDQHRLSLERILTLNQSRDSLEKKVARLTVVIDTLSWVTGEEPELEI